MYQIPILHPVLVHFPIAFLLLAALTALAWLVWGTSVWRQVTLILLVAGFLGGIGAYVTGEAAEEFGKGDARVELFGEQHESSALLTLVTAGMALFGLTAYARTARRLFPSQASGAKDMPMVRVVVAVLAVAAAVLVGRTGHLGGLMVWGQRVDGSQAQPSAERPHSEHEEHQEHR